MSVTVSGERELKLRLETLGSRTRQKLLERITALTDVLEARVQGAAPVKTGALRSEITERIFSDTPSRVAGYVSVFAPGVPQAYPKAATLEYGSDLPRRLKDNGGIFRRLGAGQKRIESRLTKPAHIRAFRYLRDPFAEMRPEVEAALNEALAEAIAE